MTTVSRPGKAAVDDVQWERHSLLLVLACTRWCLIQTPKTLLLPLIMHFFCHRFTASFCFVGFFPLRSAQPLCCPTEVATSLYATLEGHPPPLSTISSLPPLTSLDNAGQVHIHGSLH